MRWFMALPVHRKIVLVLAGALLSLVFDVFLSHYSWKRGTMKWNQWIPIIYGLLAFVGLALPALRQLESRAETRLLLVIGGLGVLVGVAGIVFHLLGFVEDMEGESWTLRTVGETLSSAPPPMAPVAFAGIGLLLATLKRITGAK